MRDGYTRAREKRCGQCSNCKKLEKVKTAVLRACNPPFSHADDDVVKLWNEELKRLPCLGDTHDDQEVATPSCDS